MWSRFPEECMEEHGLPNRHIWGKIIVRANIGYTILQFWRIDRNTIENDGTTDLCPPSIEVIGNDIAQGSSFRTWKKIIRELEIQWNDDRVKKNRRR